MKKVFLLITVLVSLLSFSCVDVATAQERLSREQFKIKQQTYLMEKAGLTVEESAKFFPIYFELQDKKTEINNSYWKVFQNIKPGETTEAQYKEMLTTIYDTRIRIDKLEQSYSEKFLKIISAEKLCKIFMAETNFHRDLMRGFGNFGGNRNNNNNNGGNRPQRGFGQFCINVMLVILGAGERDAYQPFPFSNCLASFHSLSSSSRGISFMFFPCFMLCSSTYPKRRINFWLVLSKALSGLIL